MPKLPDLRPAQPLMVSFALLLETPSVLLHNDKSAIAWSGKGPLAVPIKVRGDGLVIFNFDETVDFASPAIPSWQPEDGEHILKAIQEADARRTDVGYARFEYMNAWLAAYGSGMAVIASHGIICQPPVDPDRHYKAVEQNGRWIAFDNRHELAIGAKGGSVVNEAVFDYTIALMKAAEARFGENYATTLALLHQASHQYVRHQFASAHLLAWTLTEQVIHILWRDFQNSVSSGNNAITSINGDRRKLLEGRDYTASIITQILSLAGRISDERLKSLDTVRKARNDFAHKLKLIEVDQASKALGTAADMLSELLGIKVAVPLTTTFWI